MKMEQGKFRYADMAMDKDAITNWGHGSTKDGQLAGMEDLKCVYKAYTISSHEKLLDDHWKDVQNNIESRWH